MEPERYQTALSADLSEFIETVTDMRGEEELEQTLDAVLNQTRLACMADAASMLLVSGRTITVAAASHDLARRADELQMTCNEGPCLEAVTLRSNYLAKDSGQTSAGQSGAHGCQSLVGCP